jgi:hypothetical protein
MPEERLEKQKTHRPDTLAMGLQKRFRLELRLYTPGLPSPKDTRVQQVQQQQLGIVFWRREFICKYRNLNRTANATCKFPIDLKGAC